jgi:hypothetical protein
LRPWHFRPDQPDTTNALTRARSPRPKPNKANPTQTDTDPNTAIGELTGGTLNDTTIQARFASIGPARDPRPCTLSPPAIMLPVGPTGGAGQLPTQDDIATAEFVSQVKGQDTMIDRYLQLLNAQTAVSR